VKGESEMAVHGDCTSKGHSRTEAPTLTYPMGHGEMTQSMGRIRLGKRKRRATRVQKWW
jgi:hypothetical protein